MAIHTASGVSSTPKPASAKITAGAAAACRIWPEEASIAQAECPRGALPSTLSRAMNSASNAAAHKPPAATATSITRYQALVSTSV